MPQLLPALGMGAGATAALSTISTVASVVLPVMGALSANAAARRQAAEYDRQAMETRVAASVEAEQMRRAARQRMSRDLTAMAEGGVLSGTSLGVLDQNAVAMELDALMVEYRGEQAALGAEFRATEARDSAGFLPVLTAAVSGFSQMDPLNLGNASGMGAASKYGTMTQRVL